MPDFFIVHVSRYTRYVARHALSLVESAHMLPPVYTHDGLYAA